MTDIEALDLRVEEAVGSVFGALYAMDKAGYTHEAVQAAGIISDMLTNYRLDIMKRK